MKTTSVLDPHSSRFFDLARFHLNLNPIF